MTTPLMTGVSGVWRRKFGLQAVFRSNKAFAFHAFALQQSLLKAFRLFGPARNLALTMKLLLPRLSVSVRLLSGC